jgi:hypothetical protein
MAEQEPPHLRPCRPCEDCKYYNGHGTCEMYNYPVDDHDTCDSFMEAPKAEAKQRLWAAHRRRLGKAAE